MTVIVGIDPGSRVTGFGVINVQQNNIEHIAHGCLHIKQKSWAERLHAIFSGLQTVIAEHQPEEAAIEQVFMQQNVNSALKLGQARGAAIVAIAQYGKTMAEYSAREIKQAVVGYGAADKKQIQHMIKQLLQLAVIPASDAADALAVAVCHAHCRRVKQRYQQALAK